MVDFDALKTAINGLKSWTSGKLDSVARKVQGDLDDKVDKVDGKNLSTNDYTTTEKEKLAGVEEGARKFDYIWESESGCQCFNSDKNVATADFAHAEGYSTSATAKYAHSEGYRTTAAALAAHSEGYNTEVKAQYAHTEGFQTRVTSTGLYGHAEGNGTNTSGAAQHTQGKFNVIDASGKYAHIVGNGTSDTVRSNAHTIDWKGLGWFAGGLKIGGTGQDDSSAASVATTADVADAISALGNIWRYKGAVSTADDLPTSGNALGDVYYVAADSSGYVWMSDTDGTERWEQLGPMMDLSNLGSSAGTVLWTNDNIGGTVTGDTAEVGDISGYSHVEIVSVYSGWNGGVYTSAHMYSDMDFTFASCEGHMSFVGERGKYDTIAVMSASYADGAFTFNIWEHNTIFENGAYVDEDETDPDMFSLSIQPYKIIAYK